VGEFFSDAGGVLLKTIFPILATALTTALMAVLKRQFERLGLEVSAQNEQRIKQLVYDAVLQVEELARRGELTSQEKAGTALIALRSKLPEMEDDEIASLIDTTLPVVRSRGIASNAGKVPVPVQLPPGAKVIGGRH
jgi:hypothetical protein